MPAPDIETLLDYEGGIEPAYRDALGRISTKIGGIQREDVEIVTPWFAVQLSVGSAEANPRHRSPGGIDFPEILNGNLRIEIRTNRHTNDALHPYLRRQARYTGYAFKKTINPYLLYHSVLRAWESGTSLIVEDNKDHDISMINFAITFAINRDAWPAQD